MKKTKSFFPVSVLVISILANASCQGLTPGKDGAALNPKPMEPLPQKQVLPEFNSINQEILAKKCVSCHNSHKPPHGIDLSTYEKIVSSRFFPPLIAPGKPDQSSLFTICNTGKMPKEAEKLSEEELSALFDWILNGAKGPNGEVAPTPQPTGEPGDDEDGPHDGEPGEPHHH